MAEEIEQLRNQLENKIHIIYNRDSEINHSDIIEQLTDCYSELYDAIYICDLSLIVQRYNFIKNVMPRVDSYYAVKCNHEPLVLETLAALGVGFDCASKQEIKKILDLNINPRRIIYANTIKPASYLRYAAANNVKRMTFDNEDELNKIKHVYPDAELVLRFRCDATLAERTLGAKFGCDPTEAENLLNLGKQFGLNIIGVAFHVGSGCDEPLVYNRAMYHARQMFNYANEIGYNFTLLDIGGGLWGERDIDITPVTTVINSSLDQYFGDKLNLEVISELGRYYVSAAFTLASKILGRRLFNYDNCKIEKLKSAFYYIHEGVYTSFAYNKRLPRVFKHNAALDKVPSTLWGRTCDSFDKICDDIQLPKLDLGDWLLFDNMGAYTLSMSSDFNGFSKTSIVPIIDHNSYIQLIKTGTYFNKHEFNTDTTIFNKNKYKLYLSNQLCSIDDKQVKNTNNTNQSNYVKNKLSII